MGQCFGNKESANRTAQKSHKQIELHLRHDQKYRNRVFFAGSHECIANIFCTIDGNQSIAQIQSNCNQLISGYIGECDLELEISWNIQILIQKFYGKWRFPNHYEITINTQSEIPIPTKKVRRSTPYPQMKHIKNNKYKTKINKYSSITPSISNNNMTPIEFPGINYDEIDFSSIPIPSDSEDNIDKIDKYIQYQSDFIEKQRETSQLMIAYHNLQCFKKKDYYLKWIHLLDNSLSVIFVADLSQINNDNIYLLKDMERFGRLMFYSNGKYNAKIPILVLAGINRFNCFLSKQEYRNKFEKQFNSFHFDVNNKENKTYYDEALQFIKNKYLTVFANNLKNANQNKKIRNDQTQCHKLFIRTINDVNDITEVQKVWIKLNKSLIHGNISYQLRSGGIGI